MVNSNPKQALVDFKRALEIQSEDASSHSYISQAYEMLGDRKRAIYHYNEARRISPNEYVICNNRISILYQLGFYQEVIQESQKAIMQFDAKLEQQVYYLAFSAYSKKKLGQIAEFESDSSKLVQLNSAFYLPEITQYYKWKQILGLE